MFPQSPRHVTLLLQTLFLHPKWRLDSFNHRGLSFPTYVIVCMCAPTWLSSSPPSPFFFFLFRQLVTSAGRPESNQGVFNTREERKTLETKERQNLIIPSHQGSGSPVTLPHWITKRKRNLPRCRRSSETNSWVLKKTQWGQIGIISELHLRLRRRRLN